MAFPSTSEPRWISISFFDRQIPNGKQEEECRGSESGGNVGNPKNVGNCAWSRISRKLDLNREIRGRDKFTCRQREFRLLPLYFQTSERATFATHSAIQLFRALNYFTFINNNFELPENYCNINFS